jgi:hypothetical protein
MSISEAIDYILFLHFPSLMAVKVLQAQVHDWAQDMPLFQALANRIGALLAPHVRTVHLSVANRRPFTLLIKSRPVSGHVLVFNAPLLSFQCTYS